MNEQHLVEINDAFIYISGYEWGPGVSKVIISFSCLIDCVHKEGASITTGKKERKITNIYLSNEKGEIVSERSKYITIDLDIIFDSDVSPFYYNLTSFQNEWVSKYIVNTTFHVTVGAKEEIISLNRDLINKRICPDTDRFNIRGTFSGQYKNPMTNQEELLTLQYSAYEPKELKEDEAKNPLIIWLHGQGEGGTDIDIVLLGNEVTSLTKPKIQSYFTTNNGAKGAYVLAVQCKTYWKDGGDGKNSKGDIQSRYTEILMDAIQNYIKENNDVDRNRVYIGGCSNGGFMTMNMIIQYPEYWAASYQVCEAYPYMKLKRDEIGNYVLENNPKYPATTVEQSDERYLTVDKLNRIKNIPIWFVQSADDTSSIPQRFAFPAYKELLKIGAKNCWFSLFEDVEGVDIPGMKYFGHWSWIWLFKDKVNAVQNLEKVLNSNDDSSFGFVANNNGGGFTNAVDEKGTYNSIFAWLNAQVRNH